MFAIDDHECLPRSSAKRRGSNHEPPRSQPDASYDYIYQLVEESDLAMCEQRIRDLNRQYQISFLFVGCLVPALLDSYRWVLERESYISNLLCPDHHHPPIPYRTAVIVNALWTLSLLLTSSTLWICCLCRRCLQEFRNRPQYDPKHLLAFRQMRYNSMREFKVFVLCDAVHLMIPLAALLSFSGVIMLLYTLDHPDLCVVVAVLGVLALSFLGLGLHPLFWSLLARRGSFAFSPFNFPFSWVMFKGGHSLLLSSLRLASYARPEEKLESSSHPRLALPPLKAIPLRRLVPQALASRDWLEQDCFSFLDSSNIEAIDAFLADALVWVDSNPTIEKTARLVDSINHCILDLKSPNLFARMDYGLQVARRGLAAIFHEVANGQQLDNYHAREMVSELWLKIHIERTPHKLGAGSHAETNISNELININEHLFITLFCHLLVVARNSLADGRYIEGSFEIIRHLMIDKQNMAIEDPRLQQAIFAVLEESRRYFKDRKGGNRCHQARLCLDELRGLIRAGEDIERSSHYWAEIFARVNSVYQMAEGSMAPSRTYSDSLHSSVVSSASSTICEPNHDAYDRWNDPSSIA